MNALRRGLLGPVAELWIFEGAPLDRENLADKLDMGWRVARFWPSQTVVVRCAIFLALDGKSIEARALLDKALRSFPQRRQAILLILRQAFDENPAPIAPLLTIASASIHSNR